MKILKITKIAKCGLSCENCGECPKDNGLVQCFDGQIRTSFGKTARWFPSDPLAFTDGDPGAIYSPDEEEIITQGEDDPPTTLEEDYNDGYDAYLKYKQKDLYPMNPFNEDIGIEKKKAWDRGYDDALKGKSKQYVFANIKNKTYRISQFSLPYNYEEIKQKRYNSNVASDSITGKTTTTVEAEKKKSPKQHEFIDQGIKENKDNPVAYCTSIVDKAKGTTDWRKKSDSQEKILTAKEKAFLKIETAFKNPK